MNREVHVRFDGSGRGKFPPATLRHLHESRALLVGRDRFAGGRGGRRQSGQVEFCKVTMVRWNFSLMRRKETNGGKSAPSRDRRYGFIH